MKKNKTLLKLAVIRSDGEAPCPFGLDIPEACQTVGKAIYQMAPLEAFPEASSEELDTISNNNQELFLWTASGEKCPFAREVFSTSVQCSFHLDLQTHPPVGSPYYYKHFSGTTSLDGAFSFPMGYYADTSIDRGMYYGDFSFESMGEDNDDQKK
ncbi:hypothetical protein [Schnuerera sp.]|uniref:hypothetical protein n=1 Tax=Schnuerera sp. TaxID=2794844 RepID=UPI002C8B297D|nr:hypothetical protein [Schnuerera sp.]HSH35108.1 hypothetical protein [Schnuerera sp.]